MNMPKEEKEEKKTLVDTTLKSETTKCKESKENGKDEQKTVGKKVEESKGSEKTAVETKKERPVVKKEEKIEAKKEEKIEAKKEEKIEEKKEENIEAKKEEKSEAKKEKIEVKPEKKAEKKTEISSKSSRFDRILSSVSRSSAAATEDFTPKEIIQVELQKRAVGLGFCIEGGHGSPLGDKPITVKRLYKGDAAAHGVLQAGDEIISCNGMDFNSVSHFHAWNFLKALPEGPVKLTLKRKVAL